ncbi:MAG: hypothetical protein R3C02_20840 [Planctomycetaceae bacterium]
MTSGHFGLSAGQDLRGSLRQSALGLDAAGVRRLAGAVAHPADGPEETHRQERQFLESLLKEKRR